MTTTERYEEDRARRPDGRYAKEHRCDGCGKPMSRKDDERFTDADVCDLTDGPGFFVCHRKRCAKKLEGMTVEQRRAHYTATRAAAQ